MKKHEWDSPDKMRMESGHAVFDRQTNIISTGNIIANTQFGWHIRSWWDEGEGLVDYPENKREPGHLFAFDMRQFNGLPTAIYNSVREFAKSSRRGLWLYEFRHFTGPSWRPRKVVHGYVLTRYNHRLIRYWITGPTYKSCLVISECIQYVAKSDCAGVRSHEIRGGEW